MNEGIFGSDWASSTLNDYFTKQHPDIAVDLSNLLHMTTVLIIG